MGARGNVRLTESEGDGSLFVLSRTLSGHYFGGDADDGQVFGHGSAGGRLVDGEGAVAVVWNKVRRKKKRKAHYRAAFCCPSGTFKVSSFLCVGVSGVEHRNGKVKEKRTSFLLLALQKAYME